MRRLVRFAALLAAIAATSAHAFDPLGSQRDLAGLAPPGLLPLDAELVGGPACPGPLPAALPDGRISLAETIKRALCQDPRTRQAWAQSQIQAAQVRAVVTVNRELVLLYWHIGKEILLRQQEQGWGTKVIDQLAKDLRQAFPDMQGFSPRNLKYMRAF